MPEILEGLISKTPELAVVVLFLKYITALSKEHSKSMNARDELIRAMHNDHMKSNADTRVALEQNALATFQNTHALNELRDTFKDSERSALVSSKLRRIPEPTKGP